MKTLALNLRLIFSGDTVLVGLGSLVFLSSLANATGWEPLRSFRFCGICLMLISVAFSLLTCFELSKPERQKRTFAAALLFVAAVLLCFHSMHFTIVRGS